MAEGQDGSADEVGDHSGGWLRDMSAQSARAQEFGRRLRWLRLRRQLAGPAQRRRPADVIELRDAQAAEAQTARTIAEPAAPHQRG